MTSEFIRYSTFSSALEITELVLGNEHLHLIRFNNLRIQSGTVLLIELLDLVYITASASPP